MTISRQAFFDEAREVTLASVSMLLEQLKAGWPAGESISAMGMSTYMMGVHIGLAVSQKDVYAAKKILDWMTSSLKADTGPIIGSLSIDAIKSLDAKAEALLKLAERGSKPVG